ncbi:MAG: siphovirus Gp157 family protein [Clostridia bacterium]|nr:siphovirus Gp157 family protein [Clostridia bacterium]
MPNLYMLSKDVETLYSDLMNSVNEETGEIDVDIAGALAVKEEEFDTKAVAVATVMRRFESSEKEIDAEIKRLTALKNRAKAVKERLKSSLSEACQRLGRTKIEGISATIGFRKSEKTVVDNEELLPDDYFNITMTKKPDLTKIKQAIQLGLDVPGAHVETVQNIQIK